MSASVSFEVHVATTVSVEPDQAMLWSQGCTGSWRSTRVRKWTSFSNGVAVSPVIEVTGTEYDFAVEVLARGTGGQLPIYHPHTGMLTAGGPGQFLIRPLVSVSGRNPSMVVGPGSNVDVVAGTEPGVEAKMSMFAFNDVTWSMDGKAPVFMDISPMRLEGESHFLTVVKGPAGHFLEGDEFSSLMGPNGYVAPSRPEVYNVSSWNGTCQGTPKCPFVVGGIASGAYSVAPGFRDLLDVKVRPRDWEAMSTCKILPWNLTVDIPTPVSARLVVQGQAGFKVSVSTGGGSEILYPTRSPSVSALVRMDSGDEVQLAADAVRTVFLQDGVASTGFTVTPLTDLSAGPRGSVVLGSFTGAGRTFQLSATLLGGRVNTSNSITVTVVAASALVLGARKVTGASGDSGVDGSTLGEVVCQGSGVWQQAQLRSDLFMSDGSVLPDVSAGYSCPGSAVFTCTASGRISVMPASMQGVISKVGIVTSAFMGHTATIAITAAANRRVAVSNAIMSSTPDKGMIRSNGTGSVALEVILSDGTSIDNWFSDAGRTRALPPVFSCSSSQPTALDVNSSTCVYAVRGNSNGPAIVTVSTRNGSCSGAGEWNQTTPIQTNLLPETVDIDIGLNTRLNPPITMIRGPTRVPIRLTTGGFSVVDVGVSVFYDEDVLSVVSCSISAPASSLFRYSSCLHDETPGVVTLVGIATGSGASNPIASVGMELASIIFTPASAMLVSSSKGTTFIESRFDFLRAGGMICGQDPRPACPSTYSGRAIPVDVSGMLTGGRRLLSFPKQGRKPIRVYRISDWPNTTRALFSSPTKILSVREATEFVNGDADGGGAFDQDDVHFAVDYFRGSDPVGCNTAKGCRQRANITEWQRRAMLAINDPVDTSGARDVFHLFSVLVGTARFIEPVNVQSAPGSLQLGVRLVTANDTADPVDRTTVWFLINSSVASGLSPPAGFFTQLSPGLTEVRARYVGDGVHGCNITVSGNLSNVGVVVRVQRLNMLGIPSESRLVELHNSNRTGTSVQGFRPVSTIKSLGPAPPMPPLQAPRNVSITGPLVSINNAQNTSVSRGDVAVTIQANSFLGGQTAIFINASSQSFDVLGISVPQSSVAISPALLFNIVPATSVLDKVALVSFSVPALPSGGRRLMQGQEATILIKSTVSGPWKRLSSQRLLGRVISGEVQPRDIVNGLFGVLVCPFLLTDPGAFDTSWEPGQATPPPEQGTPSYPTDIVLVLVLVLVGVMWCRPTKPGQAALAREEVNPFAGASAPPPPPSSATFKQMPPDVRPTLIYGSGETPLESKLDSMFKVSIIRSNRWNR